MSTNPRLPLFPITTTIDTAKVAGAPANPTLHVAGCNLRELADEWGTPLYAYDQATLDASVAAYRDALARHYPGESALTYAGKAFLCTAMAQWTQRWDLWLDCTGAGELQVARAAEVPRARTLVHGVNKSVADLAAAVAQAGVIVVDNLPELRRLASLLHNRDKTGPALWIRIRPGLAVETHAYTQTGQVDSKFGMGLDEAQEAIRFCRQRALPLSGLHFHQGSHFHDPAPIGPALDAVLTLMVTLRRESDWLPQTLCPGGGWGVAYHEDELPHLAIEKYVAFVAQQLTEGCARHGLPLPRLHLEPGRSIVARAGVAIYRVGAIKQTPGRRWLLLDGGLADNPRPALYGARYAALPVTQPNRPSVGPAWLAGPYCESGDVLIEDLPLPEIDPGELLAVPVSGAYQLSMGSNYNGARRPAVLWLHEGSAHPIQRRETLADLTARDVRLPT